MTETRRGESEEMRIGLGWVLEHFTSLFVSFESSTTMPMAYYFHLLDLTIIK